MAHSEEMLPIHPGAYIRKNVFPTGLSVKSAAELLGVGRPALSNLLNSKASLSSEMALRLEKTFGASQKQLLDIQANFDQAKSRLMAPNLAVGSYVPPFLKITAKDIETWASNDIEPRQLLAVLLRKLIHSTSDQLNMVNFPGYGNAERRGWDGQVDSRSATPWVPAGISGWEFGCSEDPSKKAEGDYTSRTSRNSRSHIPLEERANTTFVFVTPLNWNGAEQWAKSKEALREWKAVRAYDASTLEQWIEQSVPVQSWLADQMKGQLKLSDTGVENLSQYWNRWASVTDPELPKELFAPTVARYRNEVMEWLEKAPSKPFTVCADSTEEGRAFLACVFDCPKLARQMDRVVIVSSADAIRQLVPPSGEHIPNLIPVIYSDDVERELGGAYKKLHIIAVRPKNTINADPDIVLDTLTANNFSKALLAMGINDERADLWARASGRSPTILRRYLSENLAISKPSWAQDSGMRQWLIPMMLVGTWHAKSEADCKVLSQLSCGVTVVEINRWVAQMSQMDDPPIWSQGQYCGVTSKLDTLYAIHASMTQPDLDIFLQTAETVLKEDDPALELPEDQQWLAGFHGKVRKHSPALRKGICDTLVLLAAYGDKLFNSRLGIDLSQMIAGLVRRLLYPLTTVKLLSQSDDLPYYAEAAPDEFLRIVNSDLDLSEPTIFALLKPAISGILGGSCPRTGLLWALENLAWKPERFTPVVLILAKLSKITITDNWINKPDNTLLSLFRWWMPQTASTTEQRIRALKTLAKKFPTIAWSIALHQLSTDEHRIGHYNFRPRWRSDASGSGQPSSDSDQFEFVRAAVEMLLKWPEHSEQTLSDLISNLSSLQEHDQLLLWDIIDQWAETKADDKSRASLRECIRRSAFTRRSKRRGVLNTTRDRARSAYARLEPRDVVLRHQWLFATPWVEESMDELEDDAFDFQKQEERIRAERLGALRQIWEERGIEGIWNLALHSQGPAVIGSLLANEVVAKEDAHRLIADSLTVEDVALWSKLGELVRGFIWKVDSTTRTELTASLLTLLPINTLSRLLVCLPFERATWQQVDAQDPYVQRQYWSEITPGQFFRGSPDVNEAIDKLLGVNRPLAAFHAVRYALEAVETSRLKSLIKQVGRSDQDAGGSCTLEAYQISGALKELQSRPGVSEEEMAQLEFLYVSALRHTEHAIPNLQRQIGKSPSLFVQMLAFMYKRNDEGEDPPEWQAGNMEQRQSLASAAWNVLETVRIIPGANEAGEIDLNTLRTWLSEVRWLSAQAGRSRGGDFRIGNVMAASRIGRDGLWPCEEVREVLEEIASRDIAEGVTIGVINSRGVHSRGEGGDQEREIATRYRNWSTRLAFDYPFVANMVEAIAENYDHEAKREDTESAVRHRLQY